MLWALRKGPVPATTATSRRTASRSGARLRPRYGSSVPSPTAARGWRCGPGPADETRARSRVLGTGAGALRRRRLGRGRRASQRCGLFIIIALGQSILVTGAKFANLPWTAATVGAFLVAFVGSVAMWWIYFNLGAERASRHIAGSSDAGRIARLAYTYLHLPLVAGIVLPPWATSWCWSIPPATTTSRPPPYSSARRRSSGRKPPVQRATATSPALSHMFGLASLAALVPLWPLMEPLTLSAATTLVLVVVAAWRRCR